MNLYGTITGDRLVNGEKKEVTKGQGGRSYLGIIISDDEGEVYLLAVHPTEDGRLELNLSYADGTKGGIHLFGHISSPKGERQTGECGSCGAITPYYAIDEETDEKIFYCERCES